MSIGHTPTAAMSLIRRTRTPPAPASPIAFGIVLFGLLAMMAFAGGMF
ncbi:hypothetical protein [Rubrivirga sp.]